MLFINIPTLQSPQAGDALMEVFQRLQLIRNLADLTYACLPDSPSYSFLASALVTPTGIMNPAWVCRYLWRKHESIVHLGMLERHLELYECDPISNRIVRF